VAYKIEIYPEARDQIRALPYGMPEAFGEVMAMLELTPWSGDRYIRSNPDCTMRQVAFGEGGAVLVTYMILENQGRVGVLKLMWVS
jgi:hypothetical protein